MLGDAFATTQVQGFLSLEDCENSIWDYASASKGLNLTGLLPRPGVGGSYPGVGCGHFEGLLQREGG